MASSRMALLGACLLLAALAGCEAARSSKHVLRADASNANTGRHLAQASPAHGDWTEKGFIPDSQGDGPTAVDIEGTWGTGQSGFIADNPQVLDADETPAVAASPMGGPSNDGTRVPTGTIGNFGIVDPPLGFACGNRICEPPFETPSSCSVDCPSNVGK